MVGLEDKSSEGFQTTDTRMIKLMNDTVLIAVEAAVRQIKPVNWVLHEKVLEDLQGAVKATTAAVAAIDKKLFRSNGEISLTEEMRNMAGDLKRHEQDHAAVKISWKYWIPTGCSIVMAIWALFQSVQSGKVSPEQIKEIREVVETVIVESK